DFPDPDGPESTMHSARGPGTPSWCRLRISVYACSIRGNMTNAFFNTAARSLAIFSMDAKSFGVVILFAFCVSGMVARGGTARDWESGNAGRDTRRVAWLVRRYGFDLWRVK